MLEDGTRKKLLMHLDVFISGWALGRSAAPQGTCQAMDHLCCITKSWSTWYWGLGWQERTPLRAGHSIWGRCAGVLIHQGLPRWLANKHSYTRTKQRSDSTTPSEHFPPSSVLAFWFFFSVTSVLATNGWASRVEESQTRCYQKVGVLHFCFIDTSIKYLCWRSFLDTSESHLVRGKSYRLPQLLHLWVI